MADTHVVPSASLHEARKRFVDGALRITGERQRERGFAARVKDDRYNRLPYKEEHFRRRGHDHSPLHDLLADCRIREPYLNVAEVAFQSVYSHCSVRHCEERWLQPSDAAIL